MTKKVVINKCFGGFGLSSAALRALIGCPHIELMEPREYYGGGEGWEQRFAEDKARSDGLFRVTVHDGKIVIDSHRDDAARDCPRLIEVVEAMGESASGSCAALSVVEIPA